MPHVPQAGARHCADLLGTFSGPDYAGTAVVALAEPSDTVKPMTVPLYEAAAAHDGKPAEAWLKFLMRRWKAKL